MSSLRHLFGKNLRFLRKARNLTQEKLSEMIDLNQRQLTRIESGVNFPSVETLEKLCYYLDVSIKIMFDFELNQSSLQLTGTDGKEYFRAVRSGNLIKLEHISQDKTGFSKAQSNELTVTESAVSMMNVAKESKKPITVEYSDENGNVYRISTFFPDGTVKDIKNDEAGEEEKMFDLILNKFKKISNNPKKLKFMQLAMDSLDNKDSLSKLKTILEGMELTFKD